MATEFPKYTDMQRTRVVKRADPHAAPRENEAIGATMLIPKKEGLFDGLSIPQVVASAGAAATSMLLASKIGIAGSVIGAAVSSVVTLVATQLYRKALNAGARKLQSAAGDAARPRSASNPYGIGGDAATTVLPGGMDAPAGNARGARIAPTKLQARAAAQRASTQRKVTAASIAVALITVALAAAAILATTGGEGLGTRPAPVFSSHASSQQDEGTGEPASKPQAPDAPADEGAGTGQGDSTGGAASGQAGDGGTAGKDPAPGDGADGQEGQAGDGSSGTGPTDQAGGGATDGSGTTGGNGTTGDGATGQAGQAGGAPAGAGAGA